MKYFFKRCIICGYQDDFSNLYKVCKKCICKLKSKILTNKKICKICGIILLSESEICLACRNKEYHFDRTYSLFMYRGIASELLKLYKFNSEFHLKKLFSELIFNNYYELLHDIPIVSMAIRRKKKRNDCDSVKLVCNEISKLLNSEKIYCLKRIGNIQQKKLSYEQRIQNINNKIIVKHKFLKKEPPKTIVLFDDIITTGSTINSAASSLKKWGVKNVIGLTLAHD